MRQRQDDFMYCMYFVSEYDQRVQHNILWLGVGVGGPCGQLSSTRSLHLQESHMRPVGAWRETIWMYF